MTSTRSATRRAATRPRGATPATRSACSVRTPRSPTTGCTTRSPPSCAPARARARERWSSWVTWYREHGYRARAPGNNYQPGYLIAATLIAIAEAGEGDPALWSLVTDELWAKDIDRKS